MDGLGEHAYGGKDIHLGELLKSGLAGGLKELEFEWPCVICHYREEPLIGDVSCWWERSEDGLVMILKSDSTKSTRVANLGKCLQDPRRDSSL